jgi:hypothetical protein
LRNRISKATATFSNRKELMVSGKQLPFGPLFAVVIAPDLKSGARRDGGIDSRADNFKVRHIDASMR